MLLGALLLAGDRRSRVIYPLALGGVSIIASIVGTFFVKVGGGGNDHERAVQGPARRGRAVAIAFWFITDR